MNLFLYSPLGSYVSAEIGHQLGKVKKIVALDPAYAAGGGYDTDGRSWGNQGVRSFRDAAHDSLSLVSKDAPFLINSLGLNLANQLVSGGLAGDNSKARSAHTSLLIDFTGGLPVLNNVDYHGAVVDVYSNIVRRSLSLPNNLKKNWYGDSGNRLGKLEWRRINAHEGIVSANISGRINNLKYISDNPWWRSPITSFVWS